VVNAVRTVTVGDRRSASQKIPTKADVSYGRGHKFQFVPTSPKHEQLSPIYSLSPILDLSLVLTAIMMNVALYSLAETDGIRRIESFPEWVEASTKLRELAERYSAAAGRLESFQEGGVDHGHSACEQRLTREADELRGAVVRQKAILDDIEGQCTSEIARQAEPSYQAMMARIHESARNLSEAL
jgi:hypothetical protein